VAVCRRGQRAAQRRGQQWLGEADTIVVDDLTLGVYEALANVVDYPHHPRPGDTIAAPSRPWQSEYRCIVRRYLLGIRPLSISSMIRIRATQRCGLRACEQARPELRSRSIARLPTCFHTIDTRGKTLDQSGLEVCKCPVLFRVKISALLRLKE
jgi:hypothetical protein